MPTTLYDILQRAGIAAWDLGLYVVLGVVTSEVLGHTPTTRVLARVGGQHPLKSVLLAALVGMVSPLCTYGTVPVVLELLRSGVPAAPLATFLATSSLMNPQLALLTWGGLGPRLTLGRLAATLLFGLLLGLVLHFVPRNWIVRPMLTVEQPAPDGSKRPRPRTFLARCWRKFEFVGFYVVIGVLLGAAVEVLVPGRWIAMAFGSGGWSRILLASLLGVPLYACGGGTIPLVSSLIEQGMTAGAALAFLIAGPATRLPPLMALGTLFRPIFVTAYVFFLLAFSVLAGIAYGGLA